MRARMIARENFLDIKSNLRYNKVRDVALSNSVHLSEYYLSNVVFFHCLI